MRASLVVTFIASAAAGCSYDPAGVAKLPTHDDLPDDVTHPGEDIVTRQLPSGSFMMGCNDGMGRPCDTDEKPYHSVMLSSYTIDRSETTQAAYFACVRAGVCSLPEAATLDPVDRGNYPVVGVTWFQAARYCAWAGKRLPSEAEWERAARGDDGRTWPWGNEAPTCDRANFGDCGATLRHIDDGTRGTSPFGVVDMAGNAVEWVADWYDDSAYENLPPGVTDPTGPANGVVRVLRGGSYASEARGIRTSYRGFAFPDTSYELVGFRCAQSVDTTSMED
jgi:eukaryotic-like serine/threonine-protein kinase